MSRQVDRLIRLGISRLLKSEWTECYIEARELAFTTANIVGSWRGAGLIPFNKVKVFRHLPPCTPPPIASSTSVAPFDFELITSSPPNAISLHLINTALNELINTQQPLNSPTHKYVGQLNDNLKALDRLGIFIDPTIAKALAVNCLDSHFLEFQA